ncbi:MAG: Hint domain-containing protein [Pseudomonadota bacterium]
MIDVSSASSSEDLKAFLFAVPPYDGFAAPGASPIPVGRPECFVAGTKISLRGHGTKSIEHIRAGDLVTSYDAKGNLVPGRVTRVFQNRVKHILDVFGLHVTPGHVTLCGDGPFAGRHVPIIDILRSDGALVRESGEKVRACTNEPVGSPKDQLIWAVAGEKQADGSLLVTDRGQIRLGTRTITPDGYDISVADLITNAGGTVSPEGFVTREGGGDGVPFFWSFSASLPKPEAYILQRSETQLNAIYAAGEWENMAPQLPSETTQPGSEGLSTPGRMH